MTKICARIMQTTKSIPRTFSELYDRNMCQNHSNNYRLILRKKKNFSEAGTERPT